MKTNSARYTWIQRLIALAILTTGLPSWGLTIQLLGTGVNNQALVVLDGSTISSGPGNGYYGRFQFSTPISTGATIYTGASLATFTSTSATNSTGPLDLFNILGANNQFGIGSNATINIDPGSTITFPTGSFLATGAGFDFSKLIPGTYTTNNVVFGGFALGTALTLIIGPVSTSTVVTVAPAQPQVVKFELVNLSAIFSTFESGLPLAAEQREILFNLTRTATRDVGNRLFYLRAGLSLGDDAASGVAGPAGPALLHRGSDGKTVVEGKDTKDVASEVFRHLQFYTAGDFGAYDVDDIGDAHGFGQDVWVSTVGAEYRVNKHLTFGLAGSYINSSSEISRQIGSSDVEGAAVSAYGSAVWRSFYVDALYSFGSFQEDIHRHTLVGHEAFGSAESHTNSVQVNTGYTFKFGGLHTGPLASLDWVHGDLSGYSERGGGSAALDYDGQHFDSLISRLGWQLSYTAPTRFGTITPQVRASWDHEYLDSADTVSATLQNSPFATVVGSKVTPGSKFSAGVETAQPGRDYLTLGAGFAVQFSDRWSASLDYETHIFQDSETVHLASAKVSVSF